MGLFGFGKKKVEKNNEKMYREALALLENPTREKVHQAHNIMGELAAVHDYIPAILWMGDFVESTVGDLSEACFWYKKAADMGSGTGARNYADMLMTGRGVQVNPREAFYYYSIAADKGVPEAAFVLGEFLRTSGDREGALNAYKKAVSGGYEVAQERINQMMNGFI